jgi:7-keto-8-aminopelargonate synthetase-like enzyme
LFRDLEDGLQELFGAPTIVVSMTTLGHLAALPTLADERDCIVLDHQCHSSIQMAARFAQTRGTRVEVIRHENLAHGEEMLRGLARRYRTVWMCIDGVYSMYGDLAPVGMIRRWLAAADNIRLYVDDAHGMSWDGPHGRGNFLARFPLGPQVVLATSFAKATGAGGGALVFGDPNDAERVRLAGGPLVFAGPMQPPMQGALLASVGIHLSPEIQVHQRALAARVDLFNRRCDETGLPLLVHNPSPIFFIRVGSHLVAQEIARRVLDDGYLVNVSMFPTVPQLRSGLRIAMTAMHEPAEIEGLVGSLAVHLPAVLAEHGVTGQQLAELFEGAAIVEDSAGRGADGDGRGILRRQVEQRGVTRLASDLEVVTWSTIQDVPRDLWDRHLGTAGCISWEAMAVVEQAMDPALARAPEEAWSFRYLGVRDRTDGEFVALTCLNTAVQKDDMFLRADVSVAIEQRRTRDPYFLTSRFVAAGSFFSEGVHLWLDRNGPWREALTLLVEACKGVWDEDEASHLVLRDLPADDDPLSEVLTEQGLAPMPLPTSWELEVDFRDADGWLAGLARGKQRRHVQKMLEARPLYRVEAWGVRHGRLLGEVDLAHLHALYLSVAERRRKINNFPIPGRLLAALQTSPAWEIVTVNALHGPADGEAVAFYAAHRHGEHYMPLLCGVDARYIGSRDSAYRQVVADIVLRAAASGARRVHLGMDADVEKQQIGAVPFKRLAWAIVRGDHHQAELEDMIAQMVTPLSPPRPEEREEDQVETSNLARSY